MRTEPLNQRPLVTQRYRADGDEVSVTMWRHGATVALERESVSSRSRPDEVTVSMAFVVADRSQLVQFAESDLVPESARQPGTGLLAAYDEARTARPEKQSHRPADDCDPIGQIFQLQVCKSQADLITQAEAIVEMLGGEEFFFTTVRLAEGSMQPAHYWNLLSGGVVPFFQEYLRKKWFAADPSLIHAARESAHGVSSDVGLLENLSGSWREMGDAARRSGLCSWVICPVHVADPLEFGVLRVATSILPSDNGEEKLLRSLPVFRALASEIFEWKRRDARNRALRSSKLTATELAILQAFDRGSTTRDIAAGLGMKPRDFYQQVLPAISEKTGTNSIKGAVRYALSEGLLPPLAGRKMVHVVYAERWGVYLGEAYGVALWSKVNPDPDPDRDAFAFVHAFEATAFIAGLHPGHPEASLQYQVLRVEVGQTATSAPMSACIAAGVPAWGDDHSACGNVDATDGPVAASAFRPTQR
jgi:DNA-binding CsgD family transcriptional regulator